MIQTETIVKICDNSNVLTAKVIKVLGGSIKKSGKLGNFIVVSVQKVNEKIKKKIYLGYIVGTKKYYRRLSGNYIKFENNRVILLENKNKIFGNSIFGPIPVELRNFSINQIVSLIKEFV